MTPRWRAVLQVQRLLRLLLDSYVPVGILGAQVVKSCGLASADLAKAEAHALPTLGLTGQLARELAEHLIGEEPFEPGGPREQRGPIEQRQLQVVIDEIERRRIKAAQAFEASSDQGSNAVAGALDELLMFIAGFLQMGPSASSDGGTGGVKA